MKVLLVRPNEFAVEAEIENSLKAEQNVVGGNIEVYCPNSDPIAFILNEEGKLLGLDANRAMYDQNGDIYDIIAGTFFVCGVKDGEFISLPPQLMEKYKKQFFEPEMFMMENKKIIAIKVDNTKSKKSITKQMKEGAEQKERDNISRSASEIKPDKGR